MSALRESPFVHELVERTLPLEWAATRVISDDPARLSSGVRLKICCFNR